MLISGVEAVHQGPAPSAAATDDGQSTRQINLYTALNGPGSEAATTSFRNMAAADRVTSSSQRRGNLVLFVKSNDNESDAPPRTVNAASAAQSQKDVGGSASSNDNAQGDNSEDGGGDGEQEELLSLIVSAATSSGSTVLNAATGAARKPLLTAAIVLLYFILLDIVMLRDNERMNRILRRVRATDNDALVLLSSSLVRQMKDAKRDLHDALALKDPPATLERLEMIQHKALALERVCNRSLARLHLQLMFPGTVDDLTFLVEEHVDFDVQLQHLAAEELRWTQTVMAASVVHLSDDVIPDGQKFVLGDQAGAYVSVHGDHAENGRGDTTEEESVAGGGAAQANPLHNVRLERVHTPGSAAESSQVPLLPGSRLERTPATARRGRSKNRGKGALLRTEVEEVETAASGIFAVLKNRFVAFIIICGLFAAVLRMG